MSHLFPSYKRYEKFPKRNFSVKSIRMNCQILKIKSPKKLVWCLQEKRYSCQLYGDHVISRGIVSGGEGRSGRVGSIPMEVWEMLAGWLADWANFMFNLENRGTPHIPRNGGLYERGGLQCPGWAGFFSIEPRRPGTSIKLGSAPSGPGWGIWCEGRSIELQMIMKGDVVEYVNYEWKYLGSRCSSGRSVDMSRFFL